MIVSEVQSRLVEYLARITAEETPEAERRWERAASSAREYAREGQLLLARDWTADLVLDKSGQVWIVDTETAKPPVLATADDRRLVYPELLPLLPARPDDADT